MIKITNLAKKYGKLTVFESVDLLIKNRQATLIVGINGSGKTTFLETLVGMRKADTGFVSLDGNPQSSVEFKKQIFYIPSDFYLPEFMTGSEYLNFTLERYEMADRALKDKLLDIYDLKTDQNKLIETYSFGMKKKLQIIAAIASKTSYIIADELLSGLDFEMSLLTLQLMREAVKKVGLVFVTHDQLTLEYFNDAIYLMQNKRLTKYEGKVSILTEIIIQESKIDKKISEFQRYYFSSEVLPQ
ncbi:MAG: ATP-binding cassette domain-containing protein [Lactovum sp.]